MIDTLTIALMLLAALLHASWHSLVKYGADRIVVLTGMGLVACALSLCAVLFLPLPPASVLPVIAVSVALHVGYKFALARSYAFGELGQAYPLARGLVPLISTLIAFLFLSQTPGAAQLIGIAVVSAGLIWLATHSIRGGVDNRLFVAALAVSCAVAGYSVIDAYGARLAGNWASFTAWLIIADSTTFSVLAYAMRGNAIWTGLWQDRSRVLISGALGVLSFSVFLWALSRSPVGPVSALRESSVLFATLIGMALHREDTSPHKIFGAGLVVAGLIVIATLR